MFCVELAVLRWAWHWHWPWYLKLTVADVLSLIARVRYRFLVFVSTCYLCKLPLPVIPILCLNSSWASKVPAGQPYPEPLWGGRLQFLNAACRVSIHNADDNESILSFHYFSTFFFVLVLHLSLSWFCSCLELLSMECHVAVVKELEQTMWVTRKVLIWYSHMCHCLFPPVDRARCFFELGALCWLGALELGASNRVLNSASCYCVQIGARCFQSSLPQC